jgi:dipeptidyl aminopeptidase/acylaminoacyl peptidase
LTRRKRILTGIFVVLTLTLVTGYAVGGVIVYSRLSRVEAGCKAGDRALCEQNTPVFFSVNNAYDIGSPDFSAYEMADFQTVNFPSREDNVRINAWYVAASGLDEGNAPAVILVHGPGDCKRSPFILLPAGMLNHAGLKVLMIDQRNHGDSQVTDGRYAAGTVE